MNQEAIQDRTPKCHATAYRCPHCGVYAQQEWQNVIVEGQFKTGPLALAVCRHCKEYSVWQRERMIYPAQGTAPLPNPDLPEDVKSDYEEARRIVSSSPRGAAALLRLVIQKLCQHLGEKGKDLNADIGNLVRKGLDPKIQKALDIVRVTGNEAVHPGQIDLRDDAETATSLFGLVNLIAQRMISEPKGIDKLYEALPQSKREAIEKRDKGVASD